MATRGAERTDLRTLNDDDAADVINRPRKVQDRGHRYDATLPIEYTRLLGINMQGAPIQFAYIKGKRPVIVEEEAIVIRPHPCGGGCDE